MNDLNTGKEVASVAFVVKDRINLTGTWTRIEPFPNVMTLTQTGGRVVGKDTHTYMAVCGVFNVTGRVEVDNRIMLERKKVCTDKDGRNRQFILKHECKLSDDGKTLSCIITDIKSRNPVSRRTQIGFRSSFRRSN